MTKFKKQQEVFQKSTKSYVSPFFSFFVGGPSGGTQKFPFGSRPGRRSESLEWLNELVRVLWPKMDAAVQKIIHEQVRMEDGGCVFFFLEGTCFFF